MGIGQTQLSKYEKGQSAPTLEFLLKLKAHSGKRLDWIVAGEEAFRGTCPPANRSDLVNVAISNL